MGEEIKKWIWQHPNYPIFKYDKTKLLEIVGQIDYHRGILDGLSKLFAKGDIRQIEIDTLTDEAINTSLIEGEIYKRESVRSSFRKKLDKDFDALGDKYSTASSSSSSTRRISPTRTSSARSVPAPPPISSALCRRARSSVFRHGARRCSTPWK